MKAKFTIDGVTVEQTVYELEREAEDNGCETEASLYEYIRDCYLADESGFEGSYSEWLDEMYA